MISTVISLFISFLQVGLFSIGGGYATIPLIRQIIIDNHGWLTLSEFTNMITISQMTPGPLAINLATFVGKKIGGFGGSIAATTGGVLSGIIISVLIYKGFRKFKKSRIAAEVLKGLRSATSGLIASASVMVLVMAFFRSQDPSLTNLNIFSVIVFAVLLFCVQKYNLNMILAIFIAGFAGLFIS